MSAPIASKGELISLVEQLRPSNAAKAELMGRIAVSNPHLWLDGRPKRSTPRAASAAAKRSSEQ